MDHVQVAIEENDRVWKQRCNERMENLKLFPGSDAFSQTDLVQDRKIMNFEVHKAVDDGDVDGFVDVLEKVSTEKGVSLANIFDQVTQAGDSFLHVAVGLGRENIEELISYHFSELLARRNICGDTSLHVAARSKNSSIMRIILSQYALERSNSNLGEEVITGLRNAYGDTPLHVAVKSRHLGVVSELLFADNLVTHYPNKLGYSLLYLSVLTEELDICSLLLAIPFPAPLPQCRGNSPLHAAIFHRNQGFLKDLLAKKPELIYFRDEDGGTPLHYAAYIGYLEGVRTLLETSTETALVKNQKGHLPIHLACKKGHVKVVKEILQQEGLDPGVMLNPKGQNIIHVAAKAGGNDVVKYLLTNKKIGHSTINGKDVNGNTPMHLAARKFLVENLYSLSRDKRIEVNITNNEGLSALDIVLLSSKSPPTFREHLSNRILHSVGIPLSEKVSSMGRRPKPNDLNIYMVVSILLITVTFAAFFKLPCGFNISNDFDPSRIDIADQVNKPLFQIFKVCNTVAMYSSTIVFIVLLPVRYGFGSVRIVTTFVKLNLVLALVTMVVAFWADVCLVVNEVSWLVSVITYAAFSFILMIGFIILVTIPIKSSLPIMRKISELQLRILIWYSQASTTKMIPRPQ